ncbi:MAG: citrate lyase acyl carrier protein [Veillonellales bacterium]
MEKITKTGQAGTIESNDIMITLVPANEGQETFIEIVSPVIKQYGGRIRQVIEEVLVENNITNVRVQANDKGALDCTIRARVRTAIQRALA